MEGYLGKFFEHGGQIVSLAVVAAVWLGFSGLGTAAGRERTLEATPIFGWAVVSFTVTVLGVFTGVSFTWLAAALAVLGLAALGLAIRRGDRVLAPGTGRIIVLALPVIALASAMVGSQWDEFGTWLMIPRRMLVLDGFPDHETALMGGTLDAYPYGWHFVSYLASRLAGRLVENAGALANVFLLMSFALLLARLMLNGLGRDEAAAPGWGLLAVGGLMATMASATQKIALTAYADTATAVTVAFGALLGWRMLDALARRETGGARRLAFEVGLVMLVLVNLKQATVVLFALVVGAVVLAGLRDPDIRVRDLARLLPAMTLPGIVIYVVWRYYVAAELVGAEASIRPVDTWMIANIPEIVGKMVMVLSKKGLYLGLMGVAVALAVRGLVRVRTPLDRLAVITGALFLGYNAFLLFAYVVSFPKFDTLRVASLWRYNMHLAPLAAAFAAYGLAMLWARHVEPRLGSRPVAWLPIVLIVMLPLVFVDKLRFDRNPPVPHFREVGRAVAAMVKPGDRLFVVDPTGSGESGVITRFELADPAVFKGYLSIFHHAGAKRFREIFAGGGYTHLLVHSVTPPLLEATGMRFEGGVSYLLRADGRGGWTIIKSWHRR